MFKTDAGVFRNALKECKLPGDKTPRVYNDVNRTTGKRRLKIMTGAFASRYAKETWAKLEDALKQGYGDRFVDVKLHNPGSQWDRAILVYLDDTKGAPPKREPKPKPVAATFPAPLTQQELLAFWNRVSKPYDSRRKNSNILPEDFRYCLRRTTEDITVYKKVFTKGQGHHVIATMTIPAGTVVHITPKKCRAVKAHVTSMVKRSSGKAVEEAYSGYYSYFKYTVGKPVKVDNFYYGLCECAAGIHFFVNASQAVSYTI